MTWDNKSIIKRTYAAWRDEIPWTNAEIVQALRADTTDRAPYLKERRERTALYLEKGGRLSKKILSMALPLLITKCTLCGKKALYRKGSRGYCRAHRANIPKYTGLALRNLLAYLPPYRRHIQLVGSDLGLDHLVELVDLVVYRRVHSQDR